MTIITGDYTYGSDNISLLDFTHKYKVKIGKFCSIANKINENTHLLCSDNINKLLELTC